MCASYTRQQKSSGKCTKSNHKHLPSNVHYVSIMSTSKLVEECKNGLPTGYFPIESMDALSNSNYSVDADAGLLPFQPFLLVLVQTSEGRDIVKQYKLRPWHSLNFVV